jgi:hypothetical protein
MTPRKQLFRHKPAEGIYGDCHRTAIACLLDMAPEAVPHFGENFSDADKFHAEEARFLRSVGYKTVTAVWDCALDVVLATQGNLNPEAYYLLGGQSRTGVNHTVIGLGNTIAWDPSLDDAVIVGPCDDGRYWVSWLVPLQLTAKPGGDA